MRFTLLEGIFVAVVLFSAILGWARGLLREVIGLVCFGVALALVYVYATSVPLSEWIRPSFRNMLAYVFAGATLVTFLIAAWVSHFGMSPWITTPGRFLGLLFGIARGVLIFAIAVMLIDFYYRPRDLPAWYTGGRARELAVEYMRLYWPKDWSGARLILKPFVVMGIAALFLSVLTDLIAALSRPFRLRLRR